MRGFLSWCWLSANLRLLLGAVGSLVGGLQRDARLARLSADCLGRAPHFQVNDPGGGALLLSGPLVLPVLPGLLSCALVVSPTAERAASGRWLLLGHGRGCHMNEFFGARAPLPSRVSAQLCSSLAHAWPPIREKRRGLITRSRLQSFILALFAHCVIMGAWVTISKRRLQSFTPSP